MPDATIVAGSIASLNVAVMIWLIGTAVAPDTGFVVLMVGAVTSGDVPVVKLKT